MVRGPEPRAFAFWFSLLELALCAPLGLVLLGSQSISPDDILWLALAGVGIAAAARLGALAFRHGQLGVVGPLLSLEGVVAALLSFVFLGRISGIVLGGIVVSAIGSVTVAFGATRRGHLAGSSYALPAAACAGVALWAFTRQPLTPLLTLTITRIFSTLVLIPTVPKWRLPPSMRWLLAIVVIDVTADTLFLVGARAGSLPATAVLAAQFGTLTAFGGIWRWKESLTVLQIAGLLLLGAGVTAIAVS